MSTIGIPPVPIRSPVLEPPPAQGWLEALKRSVLHRELVRFLNILRDRVMASTNIIGTVDITDGDATIPPTDIPLPPLAAGTYRLSYDLRISRAATTSSSAGVTFGWTSGAVSCAQIFALVTGNTTASQTSDAITISADASSSITYALSYSSAGATSMTYNLGITVEAL